jgi:hypothetical protein
MNKKSYTASVHVPTLPIIQDGTRFFTRLEHPPILKQSYQIRNVPNDVRISDYHTRRHPLRTVHYYDGSSTADARTDAAAGSVNKKQIRSLCPSWTFALHCFCLPRASSSIPPISPPSWIPAQFISTVLPGAGMMLVFAKAPGSKDACSIAHPRLSTWTSQMNYHQRRALRSELLYFGKFGRD